MAKKEALSEHPKAHYGGGGCAFGLLVLIILLGALLYFVA